MPKKRHLVASVPWALDAPSGSSMRLIGMALAFLSIGKWHLDLSRLWILLNLMIWRCYGTWVCFLASLSLYDSCEWSLWRERIAWFDAFYSLSIRYLFSLLSYIKEMTNVSEPMLRFLCVWNSLFLRVNIEWRGYISESFNSLCSEEIVCFLFEW